MRGFMFRDQVNVISSYFEQWNQCEQVVFLYALLQKLTQSQSKFLDTVLDQSIKYDANLQVIENEANDPAFVRNLCNQPKDYVVDILLSHLLLLHPDNENAKAQYMMLIPKILNHSMENNVHIEESRHLLSYAIIHPAVSKSERRSLTHWMQNLEDAIKNHQNVMIPNATSQSCWNSEQDEMCESKLQSVYSSLQGLGSRSLPAGLGTQLMHQQCNYSTSNATNASSSLANANDQLSQSDTPNGHKPCLRRRSKSYSPVISSFIACAAQNDDFVSSANDMLKNRAGPDSAPLSPQGSVVSSGSGCSDLDDHKMNTSDGSGMKDVSGWLKTLRLHKYSYLFAQMTYEQMMNLTEAQLEQQNVTKGARHKIVISIKKLKERPDVIRALKKSIMEGGCLREALNELKMLIQTPIKAFGSEEKTPSGACSNGTSCGGDDDLPSLLTSTMGKMCTQLLVSSGPEDDNFNTYIMLIDKCLSHDSFTPTQKRRLFSWKQQVQKVWHPLPPRRSLDARLNRSMLNHSSGSSQSARRRLQVSQQQQQRHNNCFVNGKVVPMQGVQANLNGQMGPEPHGSSSVKQSASLNEHNKPASLNIQRRNSAPVRTNQPSCANAPPHKPVAEVVDPELDTRLRSLCLSVTEHALAGSDNSCQY